MKILWATTFSADLYESSGRHLLESFVATKTEGTLAVYAEGMSLPTKPHANIRPHSLDKDPFLAAFLERNKDIIPATLGGELAAPECRCRKGPFDVHSKKHQLPCPGYWFCKNAYRWLRKVLAAKRASDEYADEHDIMIWVDSDAAFARQVTADVVRSWFPPKTGCIYLKHGRDEIETGVVGYHLQHGGRKIIGTMLSRYETGVFRKDLRWDDCHQLGQAVRTARKVKNIRSIDLATKVGPNNTVIQFSPLGPYLEHHKGHHRRNKVIV